MRLRTSLASCLVLALGLVACGQKPGVHRVGISDGVGGDGLVGDGGGAGTDGGTGTDGGAGTDGGTGTDGGAGTDGGGSGAGGGGGSGGSGGGGGTVGGPADRTGITADTITIGIHAPTSGAAPIEPKAFQYGADTYWKWIESKGIKIHGRKVKVVFRDDGYKPGTAVDRCTEMAKVEKAFLLIGAAGTDQIRACADYANRNRIPYFSAGVQEKAVSGYRTYSALSMSYAQQMKLLVQYWKNEGMNLDKYSPRGIAQKDGKVTIGFVRPNTANFDDAGAALKREFAALGASFVLKTVTVEKDGKPENANAAVTKLRDSGVDVVSPITPPNFTLLLVNAAGGQQYKPRYMGVGVTNGLNQAIAQMCRNNDFENAMFFSPWPAWSARNTQGVGDPDFDRAVAQDDARAINSRNAGGDLLMALWGINKTLHRILEAAGPNLTRQSLVAMMNTFQTKTGFFPDLSFSLSSNFGASGVHALIGRCGTTEFVEDPANPGLNTSF